MADSSNPFSGIFSSLEAVEQQKIAVEEQKCELGRVLTRIFLCTPNSSVEGDPNRPEFVVTLPQLAKDHERQGKSGDLDLDTLTQGLVERLQMTDPSVHLVHCKLGKNSGPYSMKDAVELSQIDYLARCYVRSCKEAGEGQRETGGRVFGHVVEECKRVIVEMCSPVLDRPIYVSSFTDLCMCPIQHSGKDAVPIEFIYRIAEYHANNFPKLKSLFDPPLLKLYATSSTISLASGKVFDCVSLLEAYCRNSHLAKVLVDSDYWLPPPASRLGKSFETTTILGRLLSLTTISPSHTQPSDYFPVDGNILDKSEVDTMTHSLHTELNILTTHMHKVFDGLLRAGPDVKDALIRWIVECLEQNKDRGKMMSRLLSAQHMPHMVCASDGFFLNLGWVLLKLAAPFTKAGGPVFRFPSIDPLYCVAAAREQRDNSLLNFTSETRMAPADSDDAAPPLEPESTFNFVTHCFFLTHKSLTLGWSQTLQRFADFMRLYSNAFYARQRIAQSGDLTSPLHHQVHSQFLLLHSQLLGFKAHMGHPQLLDLSLMFHATTARWLVWLVTQRSHDISTQSHDLSIHFPLPNKAPAEMRAVPECLVDNMAHFVTYLERTNSDILSNETHLLSHFITFATVFMGSPQYIQNPHLRANIAQFIAIMIPHGNEEQQAGLIPTSSEPQRALFETHKVACLHLIRVLMKIFVDIEFTGDSMEFEAKFQYRIPMYKVLQFLWGLPSYRPSVEALSAEAVQYDGREQEIPTLLRFINMIINDATLQLDEGLENLVLIGELQKEERSEEWQSYTDEQKKEHQHKMSEATQMASNRNLLAGYTVDVLELITRDVQAPFVLPTMVERIVAMLNYVLKQLVGPKRRQLNVENMEKFHFHPKELVYKIVSIYVNLGQRSEFCRALPQDGRSFSLDLMEAAADIMRLLRHGELMGKLQSLIEKVRQYSEYLQLEEIALDDAPDEFLDPVTNELMKEPVRLPTSGVTMDKPNVIRHLLSDSTDPFNRSPLTADMLEPDHQLKQKIDAWRTEKLANLRKLSTE